MKPLVRRVSAAAGLAGLGILALTLGQPGPGALLGSSADAARVPQLSVLASYATDSEFDSTGAEIVAYDDGRMFIVNGDRAIIEVVDISDPANPEWLFDVSMDAYGDDITSVAAYKGVLAATVPAGAEGTDERAQPGTLVFFDRNGTILRAVPVGSLPDMVTFTHNGAYALVANEGEPTADYDFDPVGSVSIIDVSLAARNNLTKPLPSNAVRTVSFEAFNVGGPRHAELPADIRIFGPGASVAQDIEPEYITVPANNSTAYVTLQENNAVAAISIKGGTVDEIFGLGFKDHSLAGNEFDASDRDPEGDPAYSPQNWPVKGMYLPDGIASYQVRQTTYFVTANEGDTREYEGDPGFVEFDRLRALTGGGDMYAPLCEDVFGSEISSLRDNANLGRLNITTTLGVREDGNGAPVCFEELYAFGARSFSIWNDEGELVYDSGNDFEEITFDEYGSFVNSNHTENNTQGRSDDKGPEPEGVAIGEINRRTYAFIALERVGGVMVYDISDPEEPEFVQYINNRALTSAANPAPGPDLGAEGLAFVTAKSSPTGIPLLLVANEVSGTVTVFQFN